MNLNLITWTLFITILLFKCIWKEQIYLRKTASKKISFELPSPQGKKCSSPSYFLNMTLCSFLFLFTSNSYHSWQVLRLCGYIYVRRVLLNLHRAQRCWKQYYNVSQKILQVSAQDSDLKLSTHSPWQ